MPFAATLRQYFTKFGNVDQVQVMYNRETNKSRGFGFVTFESEETVENVLREKRMHEIDSKSVRFPYMQIYFCSYYDDDYCVTFFFPQ